MASNYNNKKEQKSYGKYDYAEPDASRPSRAGSTCNAYARSRCTYTSTCYAQNAGKPRDAWNARKP